MSEQIGISLNKINPFVMAPHWLLTSNVSDTAFRIYCILRAHLNEQTGEEVYPSKDAIAAMLGMKKPDSLDPHLKQLTALGAIAVIREQRGARRRNRYKINVDPPGGTYATLGEWYKDRKEQLGTNTTPLKTDVGNPNPVLAGIGYPPENGVKLEPLPKLEPRIKTEIPPSSVSLTPQAAHEKKPGSELQLFNAPPPTQPSMNLEKQKTQRRKGTRIPEHFQVTSEMVAWATENTPDVDGRYETAKFCDYWRAKSGAGATKLDWVATWRNWMRTAQDRVEGSQFVSAGRSGVGDTQAWLNRSRERAVALDAAAAAGVPVAGVWG